MIDGISTATKVERILVKTMEGIYVKYAGIQCNFHVFFITCGKNQSRYHHPIDGGDCVEFLVNQINKFVGHYGFELIKQVEKSLVSQFENIAIEYTGIKHKQLLFTILYNGYFTELYLPLYIEYEECLNFVLNVCNMVCKRKNNYSFAYAVHKHLR